MAMIANRQGGGRGQYQRQRRRDGSGPNCGGRGARRCGGSRQEQAGAPRAATSTLIAAGTYLIHDVRDADGLVRPLLRRAALSLVTCPYYSARRLAGAYLRLDPPPPAPLPPAAVESQRLSAAHDAPALPTRVAGAEPNDALLQ